MNLSTSLRLAVLLPASAVVAWFALADHGAIEPIAAHRSTPVADSLYPAPQVDPSAPPQEAAPTF